MFHPKQQELCNNFEQYFLVFSDDQSGNPPNHFL